MKPPKSRKRLLLIVLATVLALFVLFSIFNRLMTHSEKIEGNISRDTWPVNVRTVTPNPFSEKILGTGILQPMEEAVLSSEVAGKVLQIKADFGDRVKKGQTLVRIDPSAYSLNKQSAQAQLSESQSSMEVSHDQLLRKEKLAKLGHVSREELDLARNSYTAAKARVKSAKAGLAIANRNLRETTIRAPFAGRISSRTSSPGEMISPGTPVITTVKDDVIRVDLALSENQITRVSAGMSAQIILPAMNNKMFEGIVTRVGVAADRSSGSFPVRIEIDNHRFELLSGMRASIKIVLDQKDNSIVISRDFLEKANGHEGVFVVEEKDGKSIARFSPVTLGGSDGMNVLVLSGLKPGQSLVIVGQQSIKDGSQLLIVERDGRKTKPSPDAEKTSDQSEKAED